MGVRVVGVRLMEMSVTGVKVVRVRLMEVGESGGTESDERETDG